jgi:cell division protein FtsN
VTPEPAPESSSKEQSRAELDYLAWLTLMAMEARTEQRPQPEPVPPPPPPAPPAAIPHATPPLYDPPVSGIQVIPGYPNPNTGIVYRLQVGAFSARESIDRAMRQLQAAGFEAVQEPAGNNLFRVLAVGIPAQNVYGAVQRLGSIGFSQVWVRE